MGISLAPHWVLGPIALKMMSIVAVASFVAAEELNKYVSSAAEVKALISQGSDNCFLILFVWKGETEIEEQEAKGVQETFKDYPECYTANVDVSKADVKDLLYSIEFEDERENFGPERPVTRDDTPMLLGIVKGDGFLASGPKPHIAMKNELEKLYRLHTKSDITYEGAAAEEEESTDDAAEGEGEGEGDAAAEGEGEEAAAERR